MNYVALQKPLGTGNVSIIALAVAFGFGIFLVIYEIIRKFLRRQGMNEWIKI